LYAQEDNTGKRCDKQGKSNLFPANVVFSLLCPYNSDNHCDSLDISAKRYTYSSGQEFHGISETSIKSRGALALLLFFQMKTGGYGRYSGYGWSFLKNM